jgi:OmpA-OmpF porin, OOP family
MKRLLIISAMLFSTGAYAQNFYAGGAIGQTKVQDFCDGVSGAGVRCEDTDTAWKVIGGYHFNPHFALEVGYINFGEVDATGPGGTVSIESTAFELVGVGVLPLSQGFSLYGKIGLYRAETEGVANTFLVTDRVKETTTDLTFGVGARFDVTRRIALRAEWQRYQDVGGGDIGETDVDVISAGVLVKF